MFASKYVFANGIIYDLSYPEGVDGGKWNRLSQSFTYSDTTFSQNHGTETKVLSNSQGVQFLFFSMLTFVLVLSYFLPFLR